jgi:hypothetical protein
MFTPVLALLMTAGAADAAAVYKGTLSGDQETIPNASTATGFGTASLSDDMNTLTVELSWEGLSAPAAAGHIHCCAFLGANGPVAIDLAPVAAVTGSTSGVFDLLDIASYGGGFLAATGGTAMSARAALLAGLDSGQAYFNLHNVNFSAGEIRGQIAAVPEPASWALMIAGFGLVGAAVRRRSNPQTA